MRHFNSPHLHRSRLMLALAAAVTFAEPSLADEALASLLGGTAGEHGDRRFAALVRRQPSGALRERYRPIVDRPAATIVVDTCADSGPGSLRQALTGAVSGDVVDLSALTCGTITLDSGGIVTSADDVELIGPGAASLTIDAAYHGRALYHLGSGTLRLGGLGIAHGTYAGGPYYRALGGCVMSLGSIVASDTVVSSCALEDAVTDNNGAGGGCLLAYDGVSLTDSTVSGCTVTVSSDDVAIAAGVFASGNVALLRSVVSGNTVTGGVGEAAGGGIVAIGSLTVKYSTISDNAVTGYLSQGGGAYSGAGLYMLASTVSGNSADLGAGLRSSGDYVSDSTDIRNSTISGNVAAIAGAGLVSSMPLRLSNSTIAFNTTIALNVSGLYIGADTELESSIIANNAAGATERDLGGNENATITGANNLIGVTFLTVPPDTINVDPELGPLAANGGRTKTHALLAGSPAIDAGNNALDLDRDQRGEGFARVVGAAADIGAFEADPDRIFADGFDT